MNSVVPHEISMLRSTLCAEPMQKSPSCLRILKASFREVFPLRRQPRRDWVGEFAPDFYQTGETDEAKNAFLKRRDSDLSASALIAGVDGSRLRFCLCKSADCS